MHDSLRQIDIELYRDHPQDEDSYYERHNSWFFSEGIYESLYGGISRTFERNKAKQFESYKTTANSFFLFIRENWDDQYLQTLDSPIISNSIRFLYEQSNELIESFQNMTCDVESIIGSYSILNYYSTAFSLACLHGKPYNLQRSLLQRALSVIDLDRFYQYSYLRELIFYFRNKDKINFRHWFKYLFRLPMYRYIIKSGLSQVIKEGALKAELAYYLFDEWKPKDVRRTLGIKSVNHPVDGETIDGEFELPLRTMGYLAESNNVLYIAFRGSKCFKNWITNFHQISIGPRIAYLCALGLLLELRMNSKPNKRIIVCGHSLGGGLSQFAVAAATAAGYKNIEAFGYNSAGLSDDTLNVIDHISSGIKKFSNIYHICHISDIVSRIGYLLGDCYLIGKRSQVLSHKLDTIISILGFSNRLVLISDII